MTQVDNPSYRSNQEDKEHASASVPITLELFAGKQLSLRATIDPETRKVTAIVDEQGEPRTDVLTVDHLLLKEESMGDIVSFFRNPGVEIEKYQPWIVDEDGDDRMGFMDIPLDQLNTALANDLIDITPDENGIYAIDEVYRLT